MRGVSDSGEWRKGGRNSEVHQYPAPEEAYSKKPVSVSDASCMHIQLNEEKKRGLRLAMYIKGEKEDSDQGEMGNDGKG